MSNTKETTDSLDEFLKHPSKRVLLLRGAWGVGKTYFWSNIYLPKCLNTKDRINETRHAYVSLFGVNSAEEIEQLILAKSEEVSGTKTKRKWYKWGRKAFTLLDDIPKLKEYAGIIRRIGHMCIKDTLICIDDIERKGSSLDINGVLGLISVLCEHNKCKIVIIMNDEELSDNDQAQLDRYREKVIDETATYAPSVSDNCALIYKQDKYRNLALPVFERMEMNNIRVMQQSAWALEHFTQYTDELEDAVANKFCEHVIQIACFHFDRGLGINPDNLPKNSYLDEIFNKEDDDETKEQNRLMNQYVYTPSEFDKHIVDYLKSGQYDRISLSEKIYEENNREKTSKILSKYRNLWAVYNGNFQLDGSAFCNRIADFLDDYSTALTEKEFNQLLQMLNSLNENDSYDDRILLWCNAFVAGRINRSGGKHLDQLKTWTKDPGLLDEIERRRQELAKGFSITDTIQTVVVESGWNPEIVKQLSSASIDDIESALLGCTDDKFLAKLNSFCNSWRQASNSESFAESNIEQALMKIAETSPINKERVKMVIPWAFKKETKQNINAENAGAASGNVTKQ